MGIKYTALVKKALKISFNVHKDQTDKSGIPYVYHPFHIAEQMDTEDEICTALLHDVLEDSAWKPADIEREGFSSETVEALRLITRDDSIPYMEYIRRLSSNPVARRVKLADLIHNSDTDRLDLINDTDRQRLEKYVQAISYLENKIYQ